MSNVSLKNLVKTYGQTKAVDDVSVDIEEGEFFSLLGPSGCGKSTTLRMIAGFESITSGEIELDGQGVSALPPEKRDIGFVFQNYAIFPHMNVFENIAFGLRLRKLSETEIKQKVGAALEQVGMAGLEHRMQREMSGGQQQRVALARVLVTEPRILLLDEPLSALDKNLREEMKFWIKELQANLGITTIYVTHDQGEALTMSDRIAVMKDGKIAQLGTPREIYQKPKDVFVAKFIGDSSLLEGRIAAMADDKCTIQIGDREFQAAARADLKLGDTAQIVMRPEHVRITTQEPDPDWNSGGAVVLAVSYQGASLRYELDFMGQSVISESTVGHGGPELDTGQSVQVMWHPAHAWLLNTGKEDHAG
ncbi:Putrescine transport ATP-binding protein PotA [Candidatus Rhodobacter oscarellae]|uniref:Spermidine/putrescine import ATP-binding protein PotA n=1 Tax=Candidatus Rhodobacter oscarellae TaxID=1675527 RepID=A0A0J9EBW6_9RHOB|nr:ABC transporter ATP-binding protein [Candidatus Rhodobacter lobularis]KMW60275.1 Putrescine transport ATP-binding protein PotA [Candidatus Rhodobacter lobularis]